jgi:hypothetical protein
MRRAILRGGGRYDFAFADRADVLHDSARRASPRKEFMRMEKTLRAHR